VLSIWQAMYGSGLRAIGRSAEITW